jgi:hypothetical protein
MTPRRLLRLGLLVLLLAIPLAILLHDVARDVVLVALLRLLWTGRLLLQMVPQLPLWLLFLLVFIVVAVGSLLGARRRAAAGDRPGPQHPGQVRTLATWIDRAGHSHYFRWTLAQRLGTLAWEVMAHNQGLTSRELRQRFRTGRLNLPPIIAGYLESPRPAYAGPLAPLLDRLNRFLQPDRAVSPPDPALETVVHFLESQMEVDTMSNPATPNEPARPAAGPAHRAGT